MNIPNPLKSEPVVSYAVIAALLGLAGEWQRAGSVPPLPTAVVAVVLAVGTVLLRRTVTAPDTADAIKASQQAALDALAQLAAKPLP